MEIIQNISELQALPHQLHWFCPRSANDASLFFAEDINPKPEHSQDAAGETRLQKVEEARARKTKALDAFRIFAFNGEDAKPYQDWIEEQLLVQMTRCNICVREYHRGRRELKENLQRVYQDTEVSEFMHRFDQINSKRIKHGLKHANQMLSDAPKDRRSINALDERGMYAIFECLHSPAILGDESFLNQYFDEPFARINANSRIKLTDYCPAMAHFLFHGNHVRNWWAKTSWSKFKRNVTASEFEWNVRETLEQAMSRVQLSNLDISFLPRFWEALRSITEKLDADLVTHSLRATSFDICRMALDHLQVDSDAFLHLLRTIDRILRVSPQDFWDAMGTIPPNTWIEQYFASQAFIRLTSLSKSQTINYETLSEDLFCWLGPFTEALKPVQQPRTSQTFLDRFVVSFRRESTSYHLRLKAYKYGLDNLSQTLRRLSESKISDHGRTAAFDALDIVEQHLDLVVSLGSEGVEFMTTAVNVLRNAVYLNCECLTADCKLVATTTSLSPRFCTIWGATWQASVRILDNCTARTSKEVLLAVQGTVGIEKFVQNASKPLSKEAQKFNTAFDIVNSYIYRILGRISESDRTEIYQFTNDGDFIRVLVSLFLSSDTNVRSAAVDILKTLSGESARRDALANSLTSFFAPVMTAYSISLRRLAYMKTFSPTPAMLRLSKDILELLCDPSEGLLRVPTMAPSGSRAAELFWQALWLELSAIFSSTEIWANQGHDKSMMMAFCRDVMEFAWNVFDQFPVFASALESTGNSAESRRAVMRLTDQPKLAMESMVKWLRLRDGTLLSKATELISGVLKRLKDFDAKADKTALIFIEDIIFGKIKNLVGYTEKAQLHRALEAHTGETFAFKSSQPVSSTSLGPSTKRGIIDMESWKSKSRKERPEGIAGEMEDTSVKVPARRSSAAQTLAGRVQKISSSKSQVSQSTTDMIRKRKEEEAARKKRNAEQAAMLRKETIPHGVDSQTAHQGSGIAGLGVIGKDHAIPKGQGVMVSDDSESDGHSDEIDEELFGERLKPKAPNPPRAVSKKRKQQPVKKQRLERSAKDMRARLAPDLMPLHKTILAWDFFHNGDFPPGANNADYSTVLSGFRSPVDYQRTFRPLHTLEAWNGLLKVKGEPNYSKVLELKVVSRTNVDAYIEISSTVPHADAKNVSEGDLVLLSKSPMPSNAQDSPHCFGRLFKMTRKPQHVEVLYRMIHGTELAQTLSPNSTCFGQRIMSMVPLEREYGALLGLQYYDLCDEITKAAPSPLLNYRDEVLLQFMENYRLNKAQAKAVKSALDNDAFTLIQGPPGSGKTKTIVATAGALLSESLHQETQLSRPDLAISSASSTSRKLLVCAPSNAAVDELVMRFKGGVRTVQGKDQKVSVLRLGRSDNINAKVQDVTLDELVNQRIEGSSEASKKEETRKLMKQHQELSEKLQKLRSKSSDATPRPDPREFETLNRQKAILSEKIDDAKDNEREAHRRHDIQRKNVQQEIIGSAHVICATLSGSGHDLFQHLNIEFESVIIDEAAQCVELSALIPLKYGCAKCILVGDPQQLPPTVFSRQAARYKYEQSLFVRMQGNHADRVHLLDTQYRMHPDISAFPSRAFYDSKLLDGKGMASLREQKWHKAQVFAPLQFFDVQGLHQAATNGRSLFNMAEVRIAIKLYKRLTLDVPKIDFGGKVAVITPYKGQLDKLKTSFRDEFGFEIANKIEFNTTDAFQGRESEIVIFSCVRASERGTIGFLQDVRRMNVGLTRAKSSLWVLGNSHSLVRGEYWGQFVAHAKQTGRYLDGNIEEMLGEPSVLLNDAMDIDNVQQCAEKPKAPEVQMLGAESRSSSAVPSKRRLAEDEEMKSRPTSSSAASLSDVRSEGAEWDDAAESAATMSVDKPEPVEREPLARPSQAQHRPPIHAARPRPAKGQTSALKPRQKKSRA